MKSKKQILEVIVPANDILKSEMEKIKGGTSAELAGCTKCKKDGKIEVIEKDE